MEELQTLYKKLDEYSNFEIEENCEKFLDTADLIILQKNPASINILLSYFDDKSDYDWIYESISCTILNYEMNSYVLGIIDNMDTMERKAKNWLRLLIYPIINDDEYLKCLKKNLSLGDGGTLSKLFDEIYDESLEHRAIILDLKKLLNNENS